MTNKIITTLMHFLYIPNIFHICLNFIFKHNVLCMYTMYIFWIHLQWQGYIHHLHQLFVEGTCPLENSYLQSNTVNRFGRKTIKYIIDNDFLTSFSEVLYRVHWHLGKMLACFKVNLYYNSEKNLWSFNSSWIFVSL